MREADEQKLSRRDMQKQRVRERKIWDGMRWKGKES